MPRPLRSPPPSSSVARLFDLDAAARAVAEAPAAPEPGPHTPPPSERATPTAAFAPETPRSNASPAYDQPSVNREVLLTRATNETLSHLVEVFRQHTRTRLTTSHVMRAMLKGVAHCMHAIEREARRAGAMKLPSNARDRALDRERFEARLADAFVAGVRASAAFDDHDG